MRAEGNISVVPPFGMLLNWRSKMIRNVLGAAFLFAAVIAPISTASAQGVVRGADQGSREGERAAGPVGAIVGGTVGGVVGGINGILGTNVRVSIITWWKSTGPHIDMKAMSGWERCCRKRASPTMTYRRSMVFATIAIR
jgi:hypothetical protein